jgi:hypothetical protein
VYHLPSLRHYSYPGEWIVPLPQSDKGKTYGASELRYLSNTTFLVLSRDGHGRGDDDEENESDYKQIDLVSIKSATNIAGSKYDTASTAVAPNGKLASGVTAAAYVGFVDLLDNTQLVRFGLHNGDPNNATLIDSKWESLALAPVGDAAYPDDYFLFTVVRNTIARRCIYSQSWDCSRTTTFRQQKGFLSESHTTLASTWTVSSSSSV